MSARRLEHGGLIDRSRTIRFTFDGKPIEGFSGDTIASALLASGTRIAGRSFKYHRPRGIFSAGSDEPNAIVDVRRNGALTPNERATMVMIEDGMEVRSVNAAPSAEDDRKSYLDRISRFIPSAFYYKTFMRPRWSLYDDRIRAMAGLGVVNPNWKRPGLATQLNRVTDVLVVGMGPAGLAAATKAATSGKRVIMVDEKPVAGGALGHRDRDARIEAKPVDAWIAESLARLEQAGAELLFSTTAFGIYDHTLVGLNQKHGDGSPDTLWRVRADRIVLATGAIERPLPFANNDLPGILSADAALSYLHRQAVLVGETIVVAGNNSSTAEVALALAEAGAVVTLIDCRSDARAPAHPRLRLIAGRRIITALGRGAVNAVRLDDGREIACDCVCVSGGFTPTVHLYSQAKGKLAFDDTVQAFVPGSSIDGIDVIGAANGALTLEAALAEGTGEKSSAAFSIAPSWPEPGQKGRIWIDYQHDVTTKDVELAARENFTSVEHLKRYTTLGMATDQGKTSNMNGLALMAAITGQPIAETGTTTYRPPFTPVPLASFAGKRSGILFNPVRRLPLENLHRADGAVFRDYGGWLRPAYFGPGDIGTSVRTEVVGARRSVALFDGSTLGKIEVIGPGAAEFLDFIFYNTVSTLKAGRCRYVFMLTETGIVYDDGVVVRLAPDHFVVSCSTSHVAGVHSALEDWRQDRFDRTKVFIHNATAHYATLTVTGPNSKSLLAASDIIADLDDANLPHMAVTEGRFRDEPLRVARVSFTGDRSYEISIRADRAADLWSHLKAVGQKFDAILLGSEALLVLRAEKGYLIVGKDTDGSTRPADLGMTAPLRNKKVEFVGRRSLLMADAQSQNRKHYVGLEAADGDEMLPAGGHGVETIAGRHRSTGYVTSSYMSPTLGRPIALGLIENGLNRKGELIDIRHFGAMRKARITDPCFLDPEGERLNA
jgi:sarcosine oxidase subunit alpha